MLSDIAFDNLPRRPQDFFSHSRPLLRRNIIQSNNESASWCYANKPLEVVSSVEELLNEAISSLGFSFFLIFSFFPSPYKRITLHLYYIESLFMMDGNLIGLALPTYIVQEFQMKMDRLAIA